jgi:hypothetical protein
VSKLPYLVQEINAALEIYLSGRTGQARTAAPRESWRSFGAANTAM